MAAMWYRRSSSFAGEVIQDDADENASDGETALKRRTSRKQLYKRKKKPQKAQEETVYMPPTIWLATDLHYQSPQMTDFQSAFDTYTMGNDGTIVPYLDEITEAFLEEVRTAHPSALVLSGDLSQNGEKANHEALAVSPLPGHNLLLPPGSTASLCSNSPIILRKSHQELTPNYSSIIKAGDVLMQRIVRDLFTLCSSALAVVPV